MAGGKQHRDSQRPRELPPGQQQDRQQKQPVIVSFYGCPQIAPEIEHPPAVGAVECEEGPCEIPVSCQPYERAPQRQQPAAPTKTHEADLLCGSSPPHPFLLSFAPHNPPKPPRPTPTPP